MKIKVKSSGVVFEFDFKSYGEKICNPPKFICPHKGRTRPCNKCKYRLF